MPFTRPGSDMVKEFKECSRSVQAKKPKTTLGAFLKTEFITGDRRDKKSYSRR
jgi:hypothetical protein